MDDKYPAADAANHEVSPWITIDWIGWKLISWDLSQGETGTWLGDGSLDGQLRFDSFQLTHDPGAAVKDGLYFKELRIVKKTYLDPAYIPVEPVRQPEGFALDQNYPNPFNPVTTISFSVSSRGPAELLVYDMLGRHVSTLVHENLLPGTYKVDFDGSMLSSGTYVYVLKSSGAVLARKMILMK